MKYFQNTYIEKILREPLFPHPYGTKEKLHRKALLELQTRLKVGILASKHSFRARIQVCGERWKIWRRMLQLKSIFICSQQQIRSFRREKKYRELEAKVKNAIERHQDENTIAFLRAMASLSMSNWTLWINYYKFCVHRAWIFKKFTFLENYKAFPSENLTQ